MALLRAKEQDALFARVSGKGLTGGRKMLGQEGSGDLPRAEHWVVHYRPQHSQVAHDSRNHILVQSPARTQVSDF